MPRLPDKSMVQLERELRRLEASNPSIAAAAQAIEDAKKRVIEGRAHPVPCTTPGCPWHTLPATSQG